MYLCAKFLPLIPPTAPYSNLTLRLCACLSVRMSGSEPTPIPSPKPQPIWKPTQTEALITPHQVCIFKFPSSVQVHASEGLTPVRSVLVSVSGLSGSQWVSVTAANEVKRVSNRPCAKDKKVNSELVCLVVSEQILQFAAAPRECKNWLNPTY